MRNKATVRSASLFIIVLTAFAGVALLIRAWAIEAWYAHFASLCIHYSAALKTAVFWAAIAIVFSGLAYAVATTALKLHHGRNSIKRLRIRGTSSNVNIIDDSERLAAFTHGLFHPRIYVTTALVNALTKEELLGVIRHEEHHKKMFDPLRLAFLAFLRDAFYYLPAIGWLIDRAAVQKEFEADRAAVGQILDSLSYAGALVKVARFTLRPGYVAGVGINGPSPMEERVAKLIGNPSIGQSRLPKTSLMTTCIVALALALGLATPVVSGAGGGGGSAACESGQCNTADVSPIMDKDCARHCDM